jgi:hypothetical protein
MNKYQAQVKINGVGLKPLSMQIMPYTPNYSLNINMALAMCHLHTLN